MGSKLNRTKKHMFRQSVRAAVLLGCITILQTGCSFVTPAGVALTMGARGVEALASEKGPEQSIRDGVIEAAIEADMFTRDHDLLMDVNTIVEDGVVLLTGRVKTQKARIDAVKIAWANPHVREVKNEIQLERKGHGSTAAYDFISTRALKAALLFDPEVSSWNYTVDVVNGIAYLAGINRTAREHAKVLEHARTTPDVLKVVDHTVAARDRAGLTARAAGAPTTETIGQGGRQATGKEGVIQAPWSEVSDGS